MAFYNPVKLAPGVWRITDGDGVKEEYVDMYLVVGDNRAALIDCGVTGDDLWPTLRSLTDKPVTLLLGHAHGDHGAAIEQFKPEDVYLSKLENPDQIVWGKHIDVSGMHDLHDGDTFDLGGVELTAVFMPGHTPGSFVFLDKDNHRLYSSDSIGSSRIWMQFPSCPSPAEYAPYVKKLEDMVAGMDDLLVCVGHSYQPSAPLTLRYVSDTRICAEKIASGELKGTPAPKEDSPFGGLVASYGQMEKFIYRADL